MEVQNNDDKHQRHNEKYFGTRHVQILMMALCVTLAYSLRINLSVAIVAMTDVNATKIIDVPVLPWNEEIKSRVLSSFFWGYPILQVVAGRLAEVYGCKQICGIVMLLCGVFTILAPAAAIYGGPYTLIFTRVCLGLLQGFIFPATNIFVSKWVPLQEKGKMFNFIFGGAYFGTLITLPAAGLLSGSSGWPSVFYISGLISIIWSIIWFCIGASNPAQHPTITEAELSLIESSLSSTSQNYQSLKTPWKDIFKSLPVWAILISHIGQNWGYWTLLTMMPSYINSILGFNIKGNGFVAALPYLAGWIATIGYSWISDYINAQGLMNITTQRKIWNSIGLWGCGLSLVLLATIDNLTVPLAIFMLTSAVALNVATNSGFLSNHLDLSPNYAGTLMGITNGLANISSINAPLFAGLIITDSKSRDQWNIIFITAAFVMALGNLFYIIFGSCKVQHWNNYYPTSEDTGDNEQQKIKS